ncbi:Tfp pilus assembly protein PilP [Rubricella aquisinus]|uniref:Tfp pilus assembly protein PilP n=1 Tax=Rubricella aquisinus TaxID=2028108 RepID=A0A840X1Z3_9RHOB|nr:hypothetical protein [Rubricella aquisinus]MBB5515905.1 Tfp pilus assembly protein PilP [Rubricella aquisinus]
MHQAGFFRGCAALLAIWLGVGAAHALTSADAHSFHADLITVQAETSPVPRPRPVTEAPAPAPVESAAEPTVAEGPGAGALTSPQPRPRPAAIVPVTATPASNAPRPRPATLEAEAQRLLEAQQAATVAAAAAARVREQAEAPHAAPVNSARSTLRERLDMSDMALIGVFGLEENRRALLRLATGDFVRVAQGGVVDGWRVIAIGDDSIRLLRGGETKVLNIPG